MIIQPVMFIILITLFLLFNVCIIPNFQFVRLWVFRFWITWYDHISKPNYMCFPIVIVLNITQFYIYINGIL